MWSNWASPVLESRPSTWWRPDGPGVAGGRSRAEPLHLRGRPAANARGGIRRRSAGWKPAVLAGSADALLRPSIWGAGHDARCAARREARTRQSCRADGALVLGVLRPLWQTRQETASRLRGRIERVLDAAKAKGLRSGENPARWRGHLDALLPKRQKLHRGHHRALPYHRAEHRPATAARSSATPPVGPPLAKTSSASPVHPTTRA